MACEAMETLREIALEAYDRFIGLELSDVAVDGCITKAPCGGEKAGKSPVDRGKQGIKRSTAVDGRGIPLGAVTAGANRHDSPRCCCPTWSTLARRCRWDSCPRGRASTWGPRLRLTTHPRAPQRARAQRPEIAKKGQPAPLQAGQRWVVERTNSWHNAHKKLVCGAPRDEGG